MAIKYECAFSDLCLPDYFAGNAKPWLCIPVDRCTTLAEIKEALKSELNQGAIGGDWEAKEKPGFYDAAELAIDEITATSDTPFINSLEDAPEDYDGDSVYAYFVLIEVEN